MRTTVLMLLLGVPGWAGDAFGTWKVNPARSTFFEDPRPRAVTLRIERHAKGEIFTLDQIGGNGQAVTSSMILYLDGKQRDFQGDTCFGTQSWRQVDQRTVEILRTCTSGASTRVVGRLAAQANELVLEITEEQPNGRRLEHRLVLEKQSGAKISQSK